MILRKLRLQNIRSYVFQEIVFTEGTTLLAGEVGAGKSTLLLAMEFALFGFIKGEISGEALLRHGTDRGEVGLSFVIDGHDVLVVRALKRIKKGVIQDSGSLRVDGIIVPATPVELKAKILALLHYPSDLITRKSLIFRYTVYTPQEQMQLILLGDKKMRQDTLRRVFNIEKYQTATENTKIVLDSLRSEIKELQGRLHDFPLLLADLVVLESQEHDMHIICSQAQESYATLHTQVIALQEELSTLDTTLAQIPVLEEQVRSLDIQLAQLISRRQQIVQEIDALEKRQKTFSDIVEIPPISHILLCKETLEKEIHSLRQEIFAHQMIMQQQKTIIAQAERTKSALRDLSLCPTCHQEVHVSHKNHICTQEDARIATASEQEQITQQHLVDITTQMKLLEEQLTTIVGLEKQALVAQAQTAQRDEILQRLADLHPEDQNIKQLIGTLNIRKREIFTTLSSYETLRLQRQDHAKHLCEVQAQEQEKLLAVTRLEKGLEDITMRLQTLHADMTEKEKLQVHLSRQMTLSSWLGSYFITLLGTLEHTVMATLRTDFEKWFVEWFSFLLGTDQLHLTVDDEFSPVIIQHGSAISYEYLSGGERTAIALSYRLALNQVINRLVSTLQTRDLIILDEPTDGFSSTQIDRLRFVFERLQMRQVILVSHEPKIESFCDAVIYITKEGSVSHVS